MVCLDLENDKKYLFLCSMGVNRSPSAAKVGRDIMKERGLDIECEYAGLCNLNQGDFDLSLKFLNEYDRFFVMEEEMKEILIEKYGIDKKKIHVFYIEDDYGRGDLELIGRLEQSINVLVSYFEKFKE